MSNGLLGRPRRKLSAPKTAEYLFNNSSCIWRKDEEDAKEPPVTTVAFASSSEELSSSYSEPETELFAESSSTKGQPRAGETSFFASTAGFLDSSSFGIVFSISPPCTRFDASLSDGEELPSSRSFFSKPASDFGPCCASGSGFKVGGGAGAEAFLANPRF